ncbi:MAG: ATP-binding protein [Nitrospirota bacterium]
MAENALTPRLKALIGFRALFVTLLLGSSFLFRIEHFNIPSPNTISYFIIFLYILTIIYSLLINRIKNLFLFAYIQLILDVFSEIFLVYFTGGIGSWFSFTLILTVLSSSIVLNKKAGYIIASLSSILYGVLLDLQFYHILPIIYEGVIPEKQFLYNIFIHTVSFYGTAFLSGYLSHRLEKTVEKLEEKDTHLKDLEFFNIKVIESLPSGLFTTDISGNVLIFNKAAEKITGLKKSQVFGGSIEKALPFLKFPFDSGRREEMLKTGENEDKIIGINISVLKDISGKETGYIGVFQDLTQLKQLETRMKQKEKWATIGELSANIAHEIRNPLASLKGSIEMLKENKIPSKHKVKLMDIALKEMDRLNNIITDFLTYSRPKPLELKKFDIHSLLHETIDLLNTKQDGGNIMIKKGFNSSLVVEADPQKMRQVFWNLAINSIEAMHDGGELFISTQNNNNFIRIIFSDTGSGIDPSNIDRIFYPFFTTKEEGTGLGLSIAYRIIEEHNGSLIVQSIPGTKTTFEIILPKEYGKF